MTLSNAFNALKSSSLLSWKSSGKLQKTIAGCIEKTGIALHSGKLTTVKISPGLANEGRFFDYKSTSIRASIDFAQVSPLCTTLCKDGIRISTVEHLLSALEASGVDNCRIELRNLGSDEDSDVEVPILDGSAREWVEAIENSGLEAAKDSSGTSQEKHVPYLNEQVHVCKNDAFVTAFPSDEVRISYGINFPQVAAVGCQWSSLTPFHESVYVNQLASSRTFCIYEQVEQMQEAGLIKGGSLENAIVCSATKGWLNPPLRFPDEPCRHKMLDLIGDLSLLAHSGGQGIPVAHIIAYKGGHALHAEFARCLK